ncbi:hypothetical protein Pfo_000292 [Paulownia fortunei]|nr:hypothetical protein Pfo_000292 [Paulownia fortunei]
MGEMWKKRVKVVRKKLVKRVEKKIVKGKKKVMGKVIGSNYDMESKLNDDKLYHENIDHDVEWLGEDDENDGQHGSLDGSKGKVKGKKTSFRVPTQNPKYKVATSGKTGIGKVSNPKSTVGSKDHLSVIHDDNVFNVTPDFGHQIHVPIFAVPSPNPAVLARIPGPSMYQ